jgi:hypothetical protein
MVKKLKKVNKNDQSIAYCLLNYGSPDINITDFVKKLQKNLLLSTEAKKNIHIYYNSASFIDFIFNKFDDFNKSKDIVNFLYNDNAFFKKIEIDYLDWSKTYESK